MPYCHIGFQSLSPEQVENVLSTFTKESFIGGRAAYQLDHGSYSIEAGENDIRAIYGEEKAAIKFICRYERDITFYDKKLQSFAIKNNIDTSSD